MGLILRMVSILYYTMFRQISISLWGAWCVLIVHVQSACVSPIMNHWMDDDSVSNISINIFRMVDGPELEEVFFSFQHSDCLAPFAGQHRFVCDGRSIVSHCAVSDKNRHSWEIGLGQHSIWWSRFYELSVTPFHSIFGTRDSDDTYSALDGQEYCDRGPTNSTSLCQKEVRVSWDQHRAGQAHDLILLDMFSDSSNVVLPPRVFSDMQRHVNNGNYNDIEIRFDWGDWRLRCGENCLWSRRLLSSFSFHAVRGEEGTIVLNERFLQNHFMVYRPDPHALSLEPLPFGLRSPSWRLFAQFFLLLKLITAVWMGTKHTKHQPSHVWLGWTFAFLILIETYVIQYDALSLAEFFLLSALFIGFITLSSPVIYIVFVIQSVIRELDSFECVVLLVTIQLILLGVYTLCSSKSMFIAGFSLGLFATLRSAL